MLVLKLLRLVLPPFHPWKYKWIAWWYDPQIGGYFNEETKYPYTLVDTDEHKQKMKDKTWTV